MSLFFSLNVFLAVRSLDFDDNYCRQAELYVIIVHYGRARQCERARRDSPGV